MVKIILKLIWSLILVLYIIANTINSFIISFDKDSYESETMKVINKIFRLWNMNIVVKEYWS